MPTRYDLVILPGYRIGNDGSVSRWIKRRKQWVSLKVTSKGAVCIGEGGRKTTLSVGRLVLRAFGPPRPLLFRVLHFPDPDPRNNRIENLRWAQANAGRAGDPAMAEYGSRSGAGERSRILTDEEASEAIQMIAGGVPAVEIAEYLDVHRGVIDRLIAGSYPHLPRPEGITPIGDRRLRGNDYQMKQDD
jgi:hypothetical protein